MKRAEVFQNVAKTARAMADLCDRQRDAEEWWAQFGRAWQLVNKAVTEAGPVKDTHRSAALGAMERAEQE